MSDFIDEGVYYITVSPTETNPLMDGINNLVKTRPCGVIPAKLFTLVPFTINFKSTTGVSKDRSEKFHKLFRLKLSIIIDKAIDDILTKITDAEKWTNVIVDASIKNHNYNTFIKFEYGEVVSGIWEIICSNLIEETAKWKDKHGYQVDVLRTTMDIMLLFTTAGDQCQLKINQRIHDEKLKISARQWEVGLSFKKQYVWKRSWWDMIRRIV